LTATTVHNAVYLLAIEFVSLVCDHALLALVYCGASSKTKKRCQTANTPQA